MIFGDILSSMTVVLGIDTSTNVTSAAVIAEGKLSFESSQTSSHSDELNTIVGNLLRKSGISLTDIDLISYAHGPGSFTGLRIGLGFIKGLSLALHLPIVGISTLKAMAIEFVAENRLVVSCIDARRDEYFVGLYGGTSTSMETFFEPAIVKGNQIQELSSTALSKYGKQELLFVGDFGESRASYSNLAAGVVRLALTEKSGKEFSLQRVIEETPFYLRPVTFQTIADRASNRG